MFKDLTIPEIADWFELLAIFSSVFSGLAALTILCETTVQIDLMLFYIILGEASILLANAVIPIENVKQTMKLLTIATFFGISCPICIVIAAYLGSLTPWELGSFALAAVLASLANLSFVLCKLTR